MVWADVDGHIGWQAVGTAPIRPNWDGLLPVPGDGRYEWNGFVPPLELPHTVDPPRGWFGSANQDNLPPAIRSPSDPSGSTRSGSRGSRRYWAQAGGSR